LLLAAALLLAVSSLAARAAAAPPRWDEATLDTLSRIPIQDQGRVKPLSTFAIFELVKINGRMHCTSPEGEKASAMYWLMDCLFHPEIAARYRVIRIENPQVMQELHLNDDKPRNWFTLAELEPHGAHLLDLARAYSEKEDNERTLYENQILNLWDAYATYQSLVHAMDFARLHQDVPAGSPLAEMLKVVGLPPSHGDGGYHLHYSQLLANLPKLMAIYQAQQEVQGKGSLEAAPVVLLLSRLEHAANNATALTVIPPHSDPQAETWHSPGSLLDHVLHAETPPAAELETLAGLERLYDAAMAGDRSAFDNAAATLTVRLQTTAAGREQARHMPLEIFFYQARPFYWALVLFVLAAVLVAFTWMAPQSRWLARAATAAVTVPTLLLIAGMTIRCIVRGRPPVTTLYETTLFIPAVAIVVALVGEWITRRRIALTVAAALGCIGLFMAHNYELRGPDTMESMVAVLNSNFWLSTHVTTVTIGYSAGLLACAIAHFYIVGKAFGLGRNRPDFYRTVARLTYGVICFGALFAFVGTVLGGIWANDSWGRFWGWDPKENGALLIILWFLFILHARLGGYIRDLGIAAAAVFGGIVVAFSWWGVNMLGVGLHSYGFLSGVKGRLYSFYLLELVVLALAAVAYYRVRGEKPVRVKPARDKARLKRTRKPQTQS
jgi:ABC-type transport system involved in cytochrome c biogenesis permease subunit